ncbi:hypothetical protein ABZV52_07620 [Streptomyces sp. NPDC004735]|uniref:hypothetical protein n=1 Tax=Streptomyces sp. NPDC004735 TaxID=3156654 RepID=UPI0033B03CD9
MKDGEFTEEHGEDGPPPKGTALRDGYVVCGHHKTKIIVPSLPGDRHMQRPAPVLADVDERLVLTRVGQQPEPPYTLALPLRGPPPAHAISLCLSRAH